MGQGNLYENHETIPDDAEFITFDSTGTKNATFAKLRDQIVTQRAEPEVNHGAYIYGYTGFETAFSFDRGAIPPGTGESDLSVAWRGRGVEVSQFELGTDVNVEEGQGSNKGRLRVLDYHNSVTYWLDHYGIDLDDGGLNVLTFDRDGDIRLYHAGVLVSAVTTSDELVIHYVYDNLVMSFEPDATRGVIYEIAFYTEVLSADEIAMASRDPMMLRVIPTGPLFFTNFVEGNYDMFTNMIAGVGDELWKSWANMTWNAQGNVTKVREPAVETFRGQVVALDGTLAYGTLRGPIVSAYGAATSVAATGYELQTSDPATELGGVTHMTYVPFAGDLDAATKLELLSPTGPAGLLARPSRHNPKILHHSATSWTGVGSVFLEVRSLIVEG